MSTQPIDLTDAAAPLFDNDDGSEEEDLSFLSPDMRAFIETASANLLETQEQVRQLDANGGAIADENNNEPFLSPDLVRTLPANPAAHLTHSQVRSQVVRDPFDPLPQEVPQNEPPPQQVAFASPPPAAAPPPVVVDLLDHTDDAVTAQPSVPFASPPAPAAEPLIDLSHTAEGGYEGPPLEAADAFYTPHSFPSTPAPPSQGAAILAATPSPLSMSSAQYHENQQQQQQQQNPPSQTATPMVTVAGAETQHPTANNHNNLESLLANDAAKTGLSPPTPASTVTGPAPFQGGTPPPPIQQNRMTPSPLASPPTGPEDTAVWEATAFGADHQPEPPQRPFPSRPEPPQRPFPSQQQQHTPPRPPAAAENQKNSTWRMQGLKERFFKNSTKHAPKEKQPQPRGRMVAPTTEQPPPTSDLLMGWGTSNSRSSSNSSSPQSAASSHRMTAAAPVTATAASSSTPPPKVTSPQPPSPTVRETTSAAPPKAPSTTTSVGTTPPPRTPVVSAHTPQVATTETKTSAIQSANASSSKPSPRASASKSSPANASSSPASKPSPTTASATKQASPATATQSRPDPGKSPTGVASPAKKRTTPASPHSPTKLTASAAERLSSSRPAKAPQAASPVRQAASPSRQFSAAAVDRLSQPKAAEPTAPTPTPTQSKSKFNPATVDRLSQPKVLDGGAGPKHHEQQQHHTVRPLNPSSHLLQATAGSNARKLPSHPPPPAARPKRSVRETKPPPRRAPPKITTSANRLLQPTAASKKHDEGVAKAKARVKERMRKQKEQATKRRHTTVPTAPRLSVTAATATSRGVPPPPTDRRSPHQSLAVKSAGFGKGLREQKPRPPATGRPELTVPKTPRFASSTTTRRFDEPKPIANAAPLADSTKILRVGLRSSYVAPRHLPTRKTETGLTITAPPKFSTSTHRRSLPKSTSEREAEEMEYNRKHPFKATKLPDRSHSHSTSSSVPSFMKPTNSQLARQSMSPRAKAPSASHRTTNVETSADNVRRPFKARPVPLSTYNTSRNRMSSSTTTGSATHRLSKPTAAAQKRIELIAQERLARENKPTTTSTPKLSSPSRNRPITQPKPFRLASMSRHEQSVKEQEDRLAMEESQRRREAVFRAKPLPRTTYQGVTIRPVPREPDGSMIEPTGDTSYDIESSGQNDRGRALGQKLIREQVR